MVLEKTKYSRNITFGAEFVALRIAVELIEGLRYKLRMMEHQLQLSSKIYYRGFG